MAARATCCIFGFHKPDDVHVAIAGIHRSEAVGFNEVCEEMENTCGHEAKERIVGKGMSTVIPQDGRFCGR
jgi:hypothetical protein